MIGQRKLPQQLTMHINTELSGDLLLCVAATIKCTYVCLVFALLIIQDPIVGLAFAFIVLNSQW